VWWVWLPASPKLAQALPHNWWWRDIGFWEEEVLHTVIVDMPSHFDQQESQARLWKESDRTGRFDA